MLSYLKLGVTRGCFRFENGSAGFEALPADCNEACNRVDQSYANQVGHIVLLKSGTFALSATRSTCETSEFRRMMRLYVRSARRGREDYSAREMLTVRHGIQPISS